MQGKWGTNPVLPRRLDLVGDTRVELTDNNRVSPSKLSDNVDCHWKRQLDELVPMIRTSADKLRSLVVAHASHAKASEFEPCDRYVSQMSSNGNKTRVWYFPSVRLIS